VKNDRVFQAFEYSSFNVLNEGREDKKLPDDLFEALKSFSGEKDLPYYSLTANGVRFKNFVGALQIGRWTIEVLPKIDRLQNETTAQSILIQMLRQTGFLKTDAPSESNLKLKRNYILETYLRMFLDETSNLVYKGLIKKYHKKEENSYALKGSLLFNKQINKNLVHTERFYTRHTTYDHQHELNRILLKTLIIISRLSIHSQLFADTKSLLVFFPELPDIKVSDELFGRIRWSRKTEPYKKAIEIARLLLLNYHPDLSYGKNHVLALMFDMNDLWEKWFARRLKVCASKYDKSIKIHVQSREAFWYPSRGHRVYQKPDIIIETKDKGRIILDTKWKLIHNRPSEDDLRQMYAYNMLFKSRKAFLVYPGSKESVSGQFFESNINGSCGLSFVPFVVEGKLSSNAVEDYLERILN
jgi:5-methylcytosine-specific restriction enzyme subunit McrC